MARDVVAAVVGCLAVTEVVVVTHDQYWESVLPGVRVATPQGIDPGDLNEDLRRAASTSFTRRDISGVAAIMADLPAVTTEVLTAALRHAEQTPTPVFIADRDGSGSTFYAASTATAFRPSFGMGSRARHAASGAGQIHVPTSSGARRDVDTLSDLNLIRGPGLGAYTAAAVNALRSSPRPIQQKAAYRDQHHRPVR